MELLNAITRAGRWSAAILALVAALPTCVARAGDIGVGTVAGLRQALAGALPGTTVRLAPGDYELTGPLLVPDHVVVEGSGQMTLDGGGRAASWQEPGASTLRVRGPWSGNAVELGHGSALRRLRVVDAGAAEGGAVGPGEAPNLVVVASRRPGDRVEASIVECEISTQQAFGIGGDPGPLARAVAVWTRHPAAGGSRGPGASVALTIERSIIRAPRSNALFVINFAARGQVELNIRDSRLEGVLSAAGGASLADQLTHALTTIRSRNNEYVMAGGFDRFGWHLFGGSGTPHPRPGSATPPGADHNRLRVESDGDRIEGYRTGIYAAAGRRIGALSGPNSGNRVDLDLRDLTIRTEGEGAADLLWYGAVSEPPPGGGQRLPPGEDNLMTVRMTGTVGSGPRANEFADLNGPDGPDQDAADGNRLVVEGSPEAFLRENRHLEPAPGAGSFRAGSDPH